MKIHFLGLWSFRALASLQYFRIADGDFLGLPGRLFVDDTISLAPLSIQGKNEVNPT
jgi:hypothetical protein